MRLDPMELLQPLHDEWREAIQAYVDEHKTELARLKLLDWNVLTDGTIGGLDFLEDHVFDGTGAIEKLKTVEDSVVESYYDEDPSRCYTGVGKDFVSFWDGVYDIREVCRLAYDKFTTEHPDAVAEMLSQELSDRRYLYEYYDESWGTLADILIEVHATI